MERFLSQTAANPTRATCVCSATPSRSAGKLVAPHCTVTAAAVTGVEVRGTPGTLLSIQFTVALRETAPATVAVHVQVKLVVVKGLMGVAGNWPVQMAAAAFRVTLLTVAAAVPVLVATRVSVKGWPTLTVAAEAEIVAATAAAACAVTAAGVTGVVWRAVAGTLSSIQFTVALRDKAPAPVAVQVQVKLVVVKGLMGVGGA